MKNIIIGDTGKTLDEYLDYSVELLEIPYIISNMFCDVIYVLDEEGIEYNYEEVEKAFMDKVIKEFSEVTDNLDDILGSPDDAE